VRLQPRAGGPSLTTRLAPLGAGRFAGAAQLPAQGPWRATVLVERGGARTGISFGWSVEPSDPARQVVHSARRLAPLVDRVALALAVTLAVLAGAWSLLAQRPRTIKLARIPEP
jgi:hypothetical protein